MAVLILFPKANILHSVISFRKSDLFPEYVPESFIKTVSLLSERKRIKGVTSVEIQNQAKSLLLQNILLLKRIQYGTYIQILGKVISIL